MSRREELADLVDAVMTNLDFAGFSAYKEEDTDALAEAVVRIADKIQRKMDKVLAAQDVVPTLGEKLKSMNAKVMPTSEAFKKEMEEFFRDAGVTSHVEVVQMPPGMLAKMKEKAKACQCADCLSFLAFHKEPT